MIIKGYVLKGTDMGGGGGGVSKTDLNAVLSSNNGKMQIDAVCLFALLSHYKL